MKPRLNPSCGLLILGFALTQSLSAFQDFPIQFSAGTVQLADIRTVPETPGPYPALVLIGGETDYYVQDLPLLAEAIRKRGDTNRVTRVMPKAGHTLDNPSVSNEKPVPELLPTISGWLERAAPPVPPK